MAKDVSALKAVSQNLMHANLSITDGVYGVLATSDVRGQIVGLRAATKKQNPEGTKELLAVAKRLIAELEASRSAAK